MQKLKFKTQSIMKSHVHQSVHDCSLLKPISLCHQQGWELDWSQCLHCKLLQIHIKRSCGPFLGSTKAQIAAARTMHPPFTCVISSPFSEALGQEEEIGL